MRDLGIGDAYACGYYSVPCVHVRYIYFPPGIKTFRAIRKTFHVSDPGEGVKGEELQSKTLDDSKQTANWGRAIQSFHEEVGTGGQCGM